MQKIKVKNAQLVKSQAFHNIKGGDLFVLTFEQNIPFPIKRVYFINNFDTKVVRGCHAHKTGHQAFFFINRRCKLKKNKGYRF